METDAFSNLSTETFSALSVLVWPFSYKEKKNNDNAK